MLRKNVLCALVIGFTATSIFSNNMLEKVVTVVLCTGGGILVGDIVGPVVKKSWISRTSARARDVALLRESSQDGRLLLGTLGLGLGVGLAFNYGVELAVGIQPAI